MKTQTAITVPLFCQPGDSKQYHVIANEIISSLDFIGLTISGSLLSQTTFREVTFESCVFYGTYIEHCEFIGCSFKNCRFEYSKVYDCNFSATTIDNCSWEATPIRTTLLQSSFIDLETAVNATFYNSLVENCFISDSNSDGKRQEVCTTEQENEDLQAYEIEQVSDSYETEYFKRILIS